MPTLLHQVDSRMTNRPSDQNSSALLERFRAGDEAAFEQMFRMYAVPLCAFAKHYLHSRELAAEVVHDVFLRLWELHEQLEVRDSLKAYLYRATRNRAFDVLRRDSLLQRWAGEMAREDAASMAPSPERGVEDNDLTIALEQAIAELPERRRMVVLLRWRDGFRNDEVAQLMGISIKTVENQMTQALRTLRERLAAHLT